jgi:RNA polymerase sigma-70 factor (ECF subfamily)
MSSITATPRDESALVSAARSGDEGAFALLVAPYRRPLEVHCYRMLGSLHDAEDVAQEAVLNAWRSLGRFEHRSSVSTWLYRIATNGCLDELARRPRRPLLAIEPYPDARLADVASPVADPAARYAAREGIELAFLTSIQRLSGRQRAVLLLRDVLGWSAAEIAELLGVSEASVNSSLQRARAAVDLQLPARTALPARSGARESEEELARRYLEAWERDDVDALVALMRDDAVLTMPPQPAVMGGEAVAAFLRRVRAAGGLTGRLTRANGLPAIALRERAAEGESRPHRLLVLQVAGGRIEALHAFGDERVLGVFGV